MSLVFVFSGTSEGRELCEKLAAKDVLLHVFVATDYGEAVMKDHENITVSKGRLETKDMISLIEIERPEYIVDATHPHAKIVTENIKEACKATDKIDKYIRVSRGMDVSNADKNLIEETGILVSSVNEAVCALESFNDKNIMLATGVKELKYFALSQFKQRLIVRVLPGMESLDAVYKEGLSTKQIIAMEGPFSEAMNIAMINEYNAGVLVTKNSGNRGGFIEKIRACKACGIKAIIIENNNDDNGVSISDAVQIICKSGCNEIKKHVDLVGVGICDSDYLLPIAKESIKNAEVLIGAKRMIQFGTKINPDAACFCEYNPKEVCEIIKASKAEKIAVLLSGDTGLCSGAKGIANSLSDVISDDCIRIIPGISSVSYFASKLRIQHSDYRFISLHDKKCDYMKYVTDGDGIIALCSGLNDVKEVCKNVFSCDVKTDFDIYAGKNFGSNDEEIICIDDEDIINSLTDGLYVLAVLKK